MLGKNALGFPAIHTQAQEIADIKEKHHHISIHTSRDGGNQDYGRLDVLGGPSLCRKKRAQPFRHTYIRRLRDSKYGTEASPYPHTRRDADGQDWGRLDVSGIPSRVGDNALGHTHAGLREDNYRIEASSYQHSSRDGDSQDISKLEVLDMYI